MKALGMGGFWERLIKMPKTEIRNVLGRPFIIF